MKRKYRALHPFDETPLNMVVRALVAFPLKPACVWDIGFGTAKILIEAKLRYKDVKLIGFEKNPEYESIARFNMATHGLQPEDIDLLIRDVAMDSLDDVERPDAIYLSCAAGAEIDLIPKLWDYLKPGGVIICAVPVADGDHSRRGQERVKNALANFGGVTQQIRNYHNVHQGVEKGFRTWVTENSLLWEGRKPQEGQALQLQNSPV
jgi:precorrin-6B methylase 2